MKKLILVFLAGALLGSQGILADEKESTKPLKVQTVQIEGMVCELCAAKVKKNWSGLCRETTVDWKSGEGVCAYEEGKVTSEQILKAVEQAGFKAKKS